MSDLKPLVLYAHGPGANPWKVQYILEELGLPYVKKDTELSEIKKEPYISLNPNGRLPALEDPNKDIAMWESGAIIDYLIDVYDTDFKLHYQGGKERYQTWSWEHFQMSGQGPYFGQRMWFLMYHPERIQSAIDRYSNEIKRVTSVIDAHLVKQGTDYLVGDRITYADIMFVPWFWGVQNFFPALGLEENKAYKAWMDRMLERPAIAKVNKDFLAVVKPMLGKVAAAEAA